jgi:hypothetical protein
LSAAAPRVGHQQPFLRATRRHSCRPNEKKKIRGQWYFKYANSLKHERVLHKERNSRLFDLAADLSSSYSGATVPAKPAVIFFQKKDNILTKNMKFHHISWKNNICFGLQDHYKHKQISS